MSADQLWSALACRHVLFRSIFPDSSENRQCCRKLSVTTAKMRPFRYISPRQKGPLKSRLNLASWESLVSCPSQNPSWCPRCDKSASGGARGRLNFQSSPLFQTDGGTRRMWAMGGNPGLKHMLPRALIRSDRGRRPQKTGEADSDQSQHQHTSAFNFSWGSTGLLKHVIIKYQTLIDICCIVVIQKLWSAVESFKPPWCKIDFFFLFPPPVAHEKKKRCSESDKKSCLHSLQSDAMNSTMSTAGRTLHLCVLFIAAASPAKQSGGDRCTEQNAEHLIQRESDTMTPGEKDERVFFSPTSADFCTTLSELHTNPRHLDIQTKEALRWQKHLAKAAQI